MRNNSCARRNILDVRSRLAGAAGGSVYAGATERRLAAKGFQFLWDAVDADNSGRTPPREFTGERCEKVVNGIEPFSLKLIRLTSRFHFGKSVEFLLFLSLVITRGERASRSHHTCGHARRARPHRENTPARA
jgi:hypothetical protein